MRFSGNLKLSLSWSF